MYHLTFWSARCTIIWGVIKPVSFFSLAPQFSLIMQFPPAVPKDYCRVKTCASQQWDLNSLERTEQRLEESKAVTVQSILCQCVSVQNGSFNLKSVPLLQSNKREVLLPAFRFVQKILETRNSFCSVEFFCVFWKKNKARGNTKLILSTLSTRRILTVQVFETQISQPKC